MARYLFVGEAPSNKAREMGVSWRDGRLAAKQLFDALAANGLVPLEHEFDNWFVGRNPARRVRAAAARGLVVVAMGQKVSKAMKIAGIAHKQLVHPAARGKIRLKATYAQHVREVLRG